MFHIDHVQLAMPAGEESAARLFFGEVLGLAEIPKPPELAKRGGVWFALAGGQQLHLGVDPDFHASKKAHPCFVTSRFDELAQLFESRGISIQHDSLNPPARRFYVHDPFGNRIEFADRVSGDVA